MSLQNDNDTEKLRKEAEERIRDMQRRSASYPAGSDIPPVPNFVRVSTDRNSKSSAPLNQPIPKDLDKRNGDDGSQKDGKPFGGTLSPRKGFDLLKLFNFDNFKLDNDILIIIVLILLLSSEESDELLLMALVYIML